MGGRRSGVACGLATVALIVASGCSSEDAAPSRRSSVGVGAGAPGAGAAPPVTNDAPDAAPLAPPPDPPFHCTPASASSPVLAGTYLFDPAEPHPGDTLTVLVLSTNGHTQANHPEMTLDATTAKGTATETITTVTGGKGVLYYYAVPDVELGDVCLLTRIAGAPELAGKITVTPRPAPAPGAAGVYKVTQNHQFTCQEQVPWGNELHVSVLDAQGHGVPGAVVNVRLPDTTDTASIKNADTKPVPKTLVMNAKGSYDDYFWWPSNEHGLTIFDLSVQGAASDVATEISSGWWETDPSGCRYCDASQPINVYGHWSHRIVFRLDAAATQACLVPSDHAGQSACPNHGHAYHHPTHQACWPAK
jgi:plastocyanin